MTTETMMTGADATQEGAPAPGQAENTAAGAGDGARQQQAAEGQNDSGQQQQASEGQNDGGQQQQASEGAPESYEFKAPEGVQLDSAVIGAFSEVAKELDLSETKAQKVLDRVAPVIAARQAEQLKAARREWAEAAAADKEFGGGKLAENLAVAKRALDAFATPALRTLLEASGLGNHPEVVRLFYRAGKAISEDDRLVTGQGGQSNRNDARLLYKASHMNP